MSKTRQSMEDAINGTLPKFHADEVPRATLAALRAIATDVDEERDASAARHADIVARLDRQSKLVTGAAVALAVQILGAVILAALRFA